jgi:hypothetical protein
VETVRVVTLKSTPPHCFVLALGFFVDAAAAPPLGRPMAQERLSRVGVVARGQRRLVGEEGAAAAAAAAAGGVARGGGRLVGGIREEFFF